MRLPHVESQGGLHHQSKVTGRDATLMTLAHTPEEFYEGMKVSTSNYSDRGYSIWAYTYPMTRLS